VTHPFLERIKTSPLLCDGATGTFIYARGGAMDGCFDELNLTDPDTVISIHREYIAAGADIIETNTFGANWFKLEQHGLGDRVRDINFRGAKHARDAREVSGQPVFVAGSIGPTGRTLPPVGMMDPREVRAAYRDQIAALLEGGVDLLMIETIGSLEEMTEAVRAAREVSDLPIVAQMTFSADGRTISGQSVEDVAQALQDLSVDVIGVNCSVGPRGVLRVLRGYRAVLPETVPISGQPNAGWPTQIGDRLIYPSSTDYMGKFADEAIDLGVQIVGGCCGTTPEHIAAMRAALDRKTGADRSPQQVVIESPRAKPELLPADTPTELGQKIGKQFVVAVEVDPPRSLNPEKVLRGAQLLKDAGVDAVNVADSPMARIRMSALALCYMIQERIGVETILHFTTRDRNLMGLQSDLIGAHVIGVRNIIALTGDPPSLGDYPNATPVYDIDSIGLVKVLRAMNEGTDSAGSPLGRKASFTIAVACDPTRDDLEEESDRLHAKVSAGGHFIMTQPIYEMRTWTEFLEVYQRRHGPLEVPVLIGILPLQSHRHAEFLYNEVPGIRPTDLARERMRLAGNQGRTEGVKIAQELLLEARDAVHGVYIMPSFGRYEVAASVLDALTHRELTASLP